MRDDSRSAAKIWLISAWSWVGLLWFTKPSTSTFGFTVWISSWWTASQGSLAALLNAFGHTVEVPSFCSTQALFCRAKPAAHDVHDALPPHPRLQSQ